MNTYEQARVEAVRRSKESPDKAVRVRFRPSDGTFHVRVRPLTDGHPELLAMDSVGKGQVHPGLLELDMAEPGYVPPPAKPHTHLWRRIGARATENAETGELTRNWSCRCAANKVKVSHPGRSPRRSKITVSDPNNKEGATT